MKNEICEYEKKKGRYRVHIVDYDVMEKISLWKDCTPHAEYRYPDGTWAWDFLFPGDIYDRVARLVGLPKKKKNPKKVARGKRLGELAVANDYLRIQPSGCIH